MSSHHNKTLWEYIQQSKTSVKRFKIQSSLNNSESSGKIPEEKVYEMKQKKINFTERPSLLTIISDISDIIRVEYAKTVQKMTDIMIASTSHDMRTPLNTIISMLYLIKIKFQEDGEVMKMLNIAINSTHLLMYLVNDTLDFF